MIRSTPRAALPLALAGAVAAAASPVSAQVSIGGGFVLESYTFEEPENAGFEGLSLMTAPFAASVDLADGFNVTVSGAWAEGEVTFEDEEAITVSGPTDTTIRASWTLGRDLVTLSGAVFLATGQDALTAEQARVAGVVAYDLLPTRISNWGTGGGGDASIAVAVPAGDAVSLGARVGYRIVSEYEPFEGPVVPETDMFMYDAGDQLYVRAAFDANIGAASKLSLSASYQTFTEDVSEGTNIFRSGDRIQGMMSLVFPTGGGGNGWFYTGALHREEGEFLVPVGTEERPSQNVLFGGLGARLLFGDVGFVPVAELRGLLTDDGFNQGWAGGAGASLEIPLGDGPTLVPTGKFRFGSIYLTDDVRSAFTGYEIGASLRGIGR